MGYQSVVRGAYLGMAAASLLGAASGAFAQQGGLDFRLPPADDGRDSNVQGPSDNGLPPAPRQVTPPVVKPTVPPASSQASPTPKAATPAPKSATPVPKAVTPAPKADSAAPKAAAPKAVAPVSQATLQEAPVAPPAPEPTPVAELPPVASAPIAADSDVVDSSTVGDDIAMDAPATASSEEAPWWAWPLAMLIAVFAGYIYWRRQSRDVPDAVETPVVPAVAPEPAPLATPAPKATPARAPVAQPQPQPEPAVAQPKAAPAVAPRSPVAPVRPASDGFVTASPLVRRPADEMRADVAMDVEVRSLRVEADHVAVGFLLTLSNRGTMDAASLMVRIALGQGSAMNEAVLNRFYDGAGGSVLRDDIDLPAGRSEQLSSEVKLPRHSIEPLMMSGRPMMVPVLAADVTYHWDGTGEAFGQIAAAYVLGRASVGGSDKLAPIPLDQVPLAVDRPGGRATAMVRRQ